MRVSSSRTGLVVTMYMYIHYLYETEEELERMSSSLTGLVGQMYRHTLFIQIKIL